MAGRGSGGGGLFRCLFFTCSPQNQWGFIKMHFLTAASIYPMHLVFDLGKVVGIGAKREQSPFINTRLTKCERPSSALEN